MLNCPLAPEDGGDSHGHILMKTISERSSNLVSLVPPSPPFEGAFHSPFLLAMKGGSRRVADGLPSV